MSEDDQARSTRSGRPTRSDRGPPANPAGLSGSATLPYKHLGDFELFREIGRGGMGIVYEARQVSLKRRVALKVLPPGLGLTDQAVQRFEREAQAAAKLHHTNIVPVHATGQDRGCHYYAMELVEGQSLARVLDDLRGEHSNPLMEATVTQVVGSAPEAPHEKPDRTEGSTSLSDTDTGGRRWFDTVAKLLADVSDALQYAHDRGVIHRDVKPANLLLSRDGRLCLGDFGLARVAQEPGMTVSGSFLGTPAYMSPEQVAAGRVKLDHRTDVYSLGAVLYEMLTLQRPFTGDSREQILTGILSKEPKPPRRLNPRVPVDLETICLKAMEKDPDRRYASAGEMAADLRSYLQRGLIAARRAGPIRRFGKLVRRHPVAATVAAAGVALVALGAFAGWATVQRTHEAVSRTLADARLALRDGEYREALRRADEALAADGGTTAARLVRARALLGLRHMREAADDAQEVLEQDPDDWTAHLIVAAAAKSTEFRSWFEASDLVLTLDAEPHIREVERLAPETADAYYLRSLVAASTTDALALLNRALELEPGHVEALIERVHRRLLMVDPDGALADCERLLAIRPGSAEARSLRGQVHFYLQHDVRGALAELERAIEMDPREPSYLLRRAQIYQAINKLQPALADVSRAIELAPNRPGPYAARADIRTILGEFDGALADAERVLELDPEGPAGHMALMTALQRRGDSEALRDAMNRFREVSETWKDDRARATAHRMVCMVAFQAADWQRALAEADRAMALDPDLWFSYALRIQALRLTRGLASAEEDCTRFAALEPAEPGDLLERGRCLAVWCERPDLAERDYAKVIEWAPAWSVPFVARAEQYSRENRKEEALADLDHAIRLSPRWGEAYLERGQVFADLGRYEDALADFEKAEAYGVWGRTAWTLHESRASALVRLGRVEEAIAAVDAGVEERPNSADAHAARAEVLLRLARFGDAVAGMRKAVELEPGAFFRLRRLLEMMSFYPPACSDVPDGLERIRELRQSDAFMWNNIAWLHVAFLVYGCPNAYDGRIALEHARRAVATDPTEGFLQDTLGLALYRNGLYEEAERALRIAADAGYDDEAQTLFSLAMTSWKLGRKSEARLYYDRAVARMEATDPEDPEQVRRRAEAARVLGVE